MKIKTIATLAPILFTGAVYAQVGTTSGSTGATGTATATGTGVGNATDSQSTMGTTGRSMNSTQGTAQDLNQRRNRQVPRQPTNTINGVPANEVPSNMPVNSDSTGQTP